MKRRKVLQSLGLGLSAGLIAPELLISCKKTDPGPEIRFDGSVAIIGAGAAGLYTADILRSKGINVVIYEASNQVGGRIRSYRTPSVGEVPSDSFIFIPDNPSTADFPLELGPETVVGSDSIWGKIINDLTIGTFDLSSPVNRFILDNTAKTGADWSGDVDYETVQNFIANLPENAANGTSVADAAGVNARGAALLNSEAGNRYGSSADRIDAGALGAQLKLAETAHNSSTFILKASLMQDILKTRFVNALPKVKLNTAVQSIDYSGEKITITDSAGGNDQFEKVVITVPLSIMKSGGISFNPSLPAAMTTAMGKFGMDDSIRVILDFKSNFWGDALTGFIWGGTTSPQYFNAGIGRSDGYRTLTLTINGPKATELSAMGAGMIAPILAELDAVYNGLATKNIRRNLDDETVILYTIQDWSKEQYIKGAYSYPKVGATTDDRLALSTPIHDKIFFAGEATDVTGDAGTVNGALASAQRAAQEVVISITG